MHWRVLVTTWRAGDDRGPFPLARHRCWPVRCSEREPLLDVPDDPLDDSAIGENAEYLESPEGRPEELGGSCPNDDREGWSRPETTTCGFSGGSRRLGSWGGRLPYQSSGTRNQQAPTLRP
jgi:hypothetical protein